MWDKLDPNSDFAAAELAWTSFDSVVKSYYLSRKANSLLGGIHPTQKPVNLYAWILRLYAQPGWRILDTHMGSGSSVIASVQAGYEMLACEKDAEYFATAVERIGRELKQGVIL